MHVSWSLTVAVFCTILFVSAVGAQDLEPIELPAPDTEGGAPLMQALANRQTIRSFSPEALDLETLSDLCWAAFGINRPETGKRTAPSAVNWQEIDVYVALESGLYLYDPEGHALQPVKAKDIRASSGQQDFTADAPLNFIYVADYSRMETEDAAKEALSYADTGFISQNVYLFCASEGLATVVRGRVDREMLREEMGLLDTQHITLAQTIGYPAE